VFLLLKFPKRLRSHVRHLSHPSDRKDLSLRAVDERHIAAGYQPNEEAVLVFLKHCLKVLEVFGDPKSRKRLVLLGCELHSPQRLFRAATSA